MTPIPRDPALDSTLAILREGYTFIWNRCRRFESELFLTRVMGKPAVCIHGREAAELFYDESKFQRRRAIPRTVVMTLFGNHAVHTLDGDAHRHRKAAFVSLMSPSNLARLMDEATAAWRRAIARWEGGQSVVLFDESARILTAAVCAWAGVPLEPREVPRRARDLTRMVDAFGAAGPRLLKGRLARLRSEAWLASLVRSVRRGAIRPAPETALAVMAQHRELDGQLLAPRVAAVELLNVLRPTVAVSWYITFAALALHQRPELRDELAREPLADRDRDGAGAYADLFMQEVRRFFPFTPYLGAMVRAPFEWRGHAFETGTLVLLDVYGNNHDPKLWQYPESFRPERFERWNGDAFSFIPQGGGDLSGHRCPGEWITMHNLTLALHFLTRAMSYQVEPEQDLRVNLTRMPTRPKSGFVIRNVRSTPLLRGRQPRLPSRTAAFDGSAALE